MRSIPPPRCYPSHIQRYQVSRPSEHHNHLPPSPVLVYIHNTSNRCQQQHCYHNHINHPSSTPPGPRKKETFTPSRPLRAATSSKPTNSTRSKKANSTGTLSKAIPPNSRNKSWTNWKTRPKAVAKVGRYEGAIWREETFLDRVKDRTGQS